MFHDTDFRCHETEAYTPHEEALRQLGISRSTLWRWRGLIGHKPSVDGTVEFSQEEMAKLLAISSTIQSLRSNGHGQRAIMPAIYEMLRNWK